MVSFTLMLAFHLTEMNAQAAESNVLHHYVSYSLPVEPRKASLIPDTIVARSISNGLLRIGEDGQLVANIADKWNYNAAAHALDFHINPRAKYSDGSTISANDIVQSFISGKIYFKDNSPSLFLTFDAIEALDDYNIRFHIKAGLEFKNGMLTQFTEPEVAIMKIVDGKASLDVTSGPYSVVTATPHEMVLRANRYWLRYSSEMPSEVHLRHPPQAASVDDLLTDSWPDVTVLAGVSKSNIQRLPLGSAIFRLKYDRVFGFHYAGRSTLDSVRTLIGFIRSHTDFSKFASEIDGGLAAKQFFPPGAALHIENDPKIAKVEKRRLLHAWKYPTIRLAYYKDRLPADIKNAIESELTAILPMKVEFVGVLSNAKLKAEYTGQYDLLFGSLGVDVDDLEGAMSYYIEAKPAHFMSGTGEYDFKARMQNLRKSQSDPSPEYRKILNDVVENNFYLPVSYFSQIAIGRPNIDFSRLSTFGEFMPYSAIRKVNGK